MIVLDASVLIAHLEDDDALHQDATTLLRSIVDNSFGASPLTLAELMVGPARVGRIDEVVEVLRGLGVAEVPLPDDAARRLAVLRATTTLKLPDCCVILAAESVAGAVATFDRRLADAARQRGLTVHGG